MIHQFSLGVELVNNSRVGLVSDAGVEKDFKATFLQLRLVAGSLF